MKSYTCSVISAKEGVNFHSNVDLFSHFTQKNFQREHLDPVISRKLLPTPFKVNYRDGAAETLVYLEKEVHVEYPWSKMCNGNTLMYLAYPFIELQRQVRGYVTAHSAAVTINGKGILLLGKIGAGKTTLSIDLCRRYGAELIGNDITVVGLRSGRVFLENGSRFLFLRQESVRRNLPDLLSFFPKETDDAWLSKIRIDPEEIGIKIRIGSTQAQKICIVHVDENLPSVYAKRDASLVTKLFLNENFSRYIRATCLAMLGGEELDFLGYVPSYDRIELFEFRKKLISAIIRRIEYISGPLKAVADYISKGV